MKNKIESLPKPKGDGKKDKAKKKKPAAAKKKGKGDKPEVNKIITTFFGIAKFGIKYQVTENEIFKAYNWCMMMVHLVYHHRNKLL